MGRTHAGALVVIARGAHELASWPLATADRSLLDVVDELARLQLEAGRAGCAIHLRRASADLVELLDLVGLRATIPADPTG